MRSERASNHDGGEPNTAAAVHRDPLPLADSCLIHYRAEGRCEAAAERRGCREAQLIRQPNHIVIRAVNRDVFGERSPMCEARLELMIADLLISRATRPAQAARAHERNGDAIADVAAGDELPFGRNHARKLMTRHVRHTNVRIVPHPPVPIAATKTGCLDSDNDTIL